MVTRSRVLSAGSYLPARVVTNDELAKTIDTSDEWIRQRTGIRQRYIAAEGELTSDLAIAASKQALENAGLKGSDIDCIVLGTCTPDHTFPATATRVQHVLGAKGFALDVGAVCSGFVFALADIRAGDELFLDYRHLLAPGYEAEFRDGITGERIVGYEWKTSLRIAAADLLGLAARM